MKTILNIIIALLIFLIWSDVENNSVLKEPDYSNSILISGMLTVTIFIRIYSTDFKNYLMTKK